MDARPSTDPPLLIVGASGILAPLTRGVVAGGARVLAVARRAEPLAALVRELGAGDRVTACAVDARAAEGAAELARRGPFCGAALYGPALPEARRAPVLGAVHGRAVLVLTSAAADPAHGRAPREIARRRRPRPGDGVLLLGWVAGGQRWHTAEEVSRATLTLLRDGGDAVLGALRPWSQRPA